MHETHESEFWDERYASHEHQMWSGRPNGSFAAEVEDLAPGRVLDVGCGEGADAIWLAARGWDVTGVDVSSVAIERARKAADAAGVAVRWVHGSALSVELPGAPYDLVSIQYPALPAEAGDTALQPLLDAVAPGGVLLIIGHHLHPDVVRAHGHDPDRYLSLDEMRAQVDGRFQVEVHEVRPRIDPPPGAAAVDDVVLRATRLAA
jgi:SAM-dependent methyltransferase